MSDPLTQSLIHALKYDPEYYKAWHSFISRAVVAEWNLQLRTTGHLKQGSVDIHKVAENAATNLLNQFTSK